MRIKAWFLKVIYSPNTVIVLLCLIGLLSFFQSGLFVGYGMGSSEVSEVVCESVCVDCGWKGSESEHHFLDGWHVCPKCHQAEFLVSGDELDEMGEIETL